MQVIQFKDVREMYRTKFIIDGKISWEDFWALKGISFNLEKGESLGIIGENGAGKSTILKLIMGMLKPDRGEIIVSGRVSGLLELGAGFQTELTGKENIYLNASLFGLTQSQIEEKYQEIVNFADIGKFIHAPVKCYSQGMFARLAFAIAIHINPDILLIDDIFTVGDIYVQRKCINKLFELKERGLSIIFVLQDLEMLKRICSRGIFLREGLIIKDGPINTVCSYYTETVGNKEGIAILQKGPLGVVFNNGKLILKWKDETITCNLGGHSSMLISGREYLSSTANWQVQSHKTTMEIIAIGKWPDTPVTQYWKILFLNEKEFFWETMIQTKEGTFIKEFDIRTYFVDEYKGWFTLDNGMDFPKTFIHDMKEECVNVDDSIDRMIGLKGSNNKVESVPTVIFDRLNDNMKIICQIGNTGSEISGRLIQYRVFSANSNINYINGKYNRCFLSKVIIFEPQETEKLRAYLEYAKQIVRESMIIRKDSLNICCKDKEITIYWQDRLLSRGIGLNIKFRYKDRDYSALNGHWDIRKKNNEEIVITISWDDKPPFSQIWRLKLNADNTILWEIEMDINEKIKLRNKQVEMILSEEYGKWITAEEGGSFERLEKKGCAVVLKKYINAHIGVESVYKMDDLILPGIVFSYKDEIPRTSYISKIREESWNTQLRYLEIDSKENFYTPPGRYKYFEGKITVVVNHREEDNLIKKLDKRPPIIRNVNLYNNKLQLDRLSVVFDYGKGRLFWKGIEFTKELGMYSSIFLRGAWYDSSQAFWKVRGLDRKRLVAVGHWSGAPLIQTWEIAIWDEKTISWKITKETWEDVLLEREQVNLMLSDKYKEWFVHEQFHGEFPELFIEHSGIFWDRLWCGDKALSIGIKNGEIKKEIVKGQLLPSVVFCCSGDCQAHYSVIENTDNLFQARILQYELGSDQRSISDKQKYFEGQIKIITE